MFASTHVSTLVSCVEGGAAEGVLVLMISQSAVSAMLRVRTFEVTSPPPPVLLEVKTLLSYALNLRLKRSSTSG